MWGFIARIDEARSQILGAICLGLLAPARLVAEPSTNPHFSSAQVERGAAAFSQNCASCHGKGLEAGEFGPPLKGSAFLDRWGGRPVSELSAYLHASMPPAQVGELSNETYAALVALLLSANGLAADGQAGSVLWRNRLTDLPNAPPISYSVRGRQYVAIVAGYGASAASVDTVLTPEIPLPIARSSSIWVFALPQDPP